jgi:membrane-bound inhibitor of C-type lysozyme
MTLQNRTAWSLTILLVVTAGCMGIKQETLTVRPLERVTYRCEQGERITARYFSLSDNSLGFVKVLLPDGQEVTLPQALSASGVRYTDEREWVWWTKGDAAFAETRTPSGEWCIRYDHCRVTTEH